MLRHVYFPAMRLGMGRMCSGVLVFFVSAIFHELLVGLPLHMLRAWSFIGIMSQVWFFQTAAHRLFRHMQEYSAT